MQIGIRIDFVQMNGIREAPEFKWEFPGQPLCKVPDSALSRPAPKEEQKP
jgi:hypothetical protein